MTLDEGLKQLTELSKQIAISYGKHIYREKAEPHYKWEVVAWTIAGMCYPPFDQKDELLDAVIGVIKEIQRRKIKPDILESLVTPEQAIAEIEQLFRDNRRGKEDTTSEQ